ncbi:hypothetical protein AAG906_031651 [Vitis piasezkii]
MADSEIAGGVVAGSVIFLLKKLDAIVTREGNLQGNNKKRVQDLRHELRSIEALQKDIDADPKKEHDHRFQDVIDLLSLDMTQESARRRWKMRHSINDLIEKINRSLENSQKIQERYQKLVSTPTNAGNNTYPHEKLASLFLGNVDTVGMEEPRNKLVSWVLEPKQRLKMMFVVGMAGLGKTTLVHSVYERVKQHFDSHVWITASESKTKLEILLSLLAKKFGCSITPGADMVAVTHELQKYLRNKRYVMVIDDFCVKDVWESIRLALPDGNNSRIIITTRRGDIANSCRDDDSIHIHKLQPLSWENAKRLFHAKAFSRNSICPSGLEELSKSILQKCDGLPLGITEIGRLLKSRAQTAYEWQKLHDSLESELRSGGGLSNMMKVLSASYKDLHYHLKCCFLYMGIFPENKPVKRRRLVRLWIAERFYLNELIDRSLIQANEMDFDGRPKSVGVHCLMHKMILSLSHEANFCSLHCTGAKKNFTEKTRRLSIQKKDFDISQELPRLRTFFSFSTGRVNIRWINFLRLRVLDIQGTSLGAFPSVTTDLLLLRYLSLRNTDIRSIPKTVSNLQQLETLDLKQTRVKKLPKSVLQLGELRHLLVCRYNNGRVVSFDAVQGFKVPKKISALKNLQKLSFVKARWQYRMIEELQHLTQLRKLGIVALEKEDGKSLCHSIEKMRNLHSLSVTSLNKEEPLQLDAMTNPPPFLQRLHLKGPLPRFPKWVSSLHDLARIRLNWSSLSEDNPVEALQDLPNLMELQLLDAYTGTQLEFHKGKFQKLKILDLVQLKLRFIRMEDGTLPCLQKLIIRNCSELERVPVGIDDLIHLQELLLCDMPEKFVAQLKKKGGELRHLLHRISHIGSYKQGKLVEDLS